jgi:ABC-2 family transporter protein
VTRRMRGIWRRILTIFRKDLFDAIRDARVIVTLLTPLLIGIFYSFAMDDEPSRGSAHVVVFQGSESALTSELSRLIGSSVDLEIDQQASEAEVRRSLSEDNADLGLIIPAGFDDALRAGDSPSLTVLFPEDPSVSAQYVAAAVDPALRSMAGQAPPASIAVETTPTDVESLTIIDRLSLRTWSIVASMLLMVVMVAILAIPVVLAEESEKKTLDALVMIASYGEVVSAKALLGCVYIAVEITILLTITRLFPKDWPSFIATIALLSLSLLGFGLLLGGTFKSAGQLNTWSSLIMLPVITPAFLVGVGLSDTVDHVAELTPTGAAMKLLSDSATHAALIDDAWLLYLVIVLWGALAYALLFWQLSRRRS